MKKCNVLIISCGLVATAFSAAKVDMIKAFDQANTN